MFGFVVLTFLCDNIPFVCIIFCVHCLLMLPLPEATAAVCHPPPYTRSPETGRKRPLFNFFSSFTAACQVASVDELESVLCCLWLHPEAADMSVITGKKRTNQFKPRQTQPGIEHTHTLLSMFSHAVLIEFSFLSADSIVHLLCVCVCVCAHVCRERRKSLIQHQPNVFLSVALDLFPFCFELKTSPHAFFRFLFITFLD